MKIKKSLIGLIALTFSLSLVAVSAIKVSQTQAQVQIGVVSPEDHPLGEETGEVAAEAEVEEAKKEEVDYYLAYPGILPDHPLYWLKMIRDRVFLSLCRDPVAKTEKLLLYADKRLGAAKVLIEGNKVQLGVTTATKGEKYLERTVDQLMELKKAGQAKPELVDRVEKAALKHQQVLKQLVDKVPGEAKPALEEAVEKSNSYSQKLKD